MSEAAADPGSSFLSSAASAAPAAVAGNPDLAAQQQPVSGSQAALQQQLDGPPEWAPEKFWDREKKAVKVEDLGKSYKNLESLLGREKIPVVTDWENPEEVTRWAIANGRPEEPEKYELQRPELPPDMTYADELEKSFRQRAFEAGFNNRQAKAMYEFGVKQRLEEHTQYNEMRRQNRQQLEQTLERNYGRQLPDVKQTAGAVMGKFMTPELKQMLDESGYGDHPAMIDFVYKVGKAQMGDARLIGNREPTRQAQPADFDKAIANFREQHKEALWNKEHPAHGTRVRELQELYRQKNGEVD
jgi:hypothetical protein